MLTSSLPSCLGLFLVAATGQHHTEKQNISLVCSFSLHEVTTCTNILRGSRPDSSVLVYVSAKHRTEHHCCDGRTACHTGNWVHCLSSSSIPGSKTGKTSFFRYSLGRTSTKQKVCICIAASFSRRIY